MLITEDQAEKVVSELNYEQMFNFKFVTDCSFFLKFLLTSHILLLTNITDIHTLSSESFTLVVGDPCFIVIFMKGRRTMSHIF